MKERNLLTVTSQVGIIFCILIDIAVGKNQSSIRNNVERPSRSLESILDGLTALDPLAASFGAPTSSLTSPSEGSLDGRLQDTYPEQHPADLKLSRRPSSSSSYTSGRSEIDLFDKEVVSHQPSTNKYHPSQGNHRTHSSDARQKAQDELFANFPVLPYPPTFLSQMPPPSPHEYHNNQNLKSSGGEGVGIKEESVYQPDSRDRYPEDDLHDLDYYNNTYSPSNSQRNQPQRYENENSEGHHASLNKDESTPFYPSHGVISPHEVRLPIYSQTNKNYAASATSSPTREPYYQSPSSTEYARSYTNNRQYERGKQEVSHVPNEEGLEILPGLQFRGYHSTLSSPASAGHHHQNHHYPHLSHPYPEEHGHGNKPLSSGNHQPEREDPYRDHHHYNPPSNHLTQGERPLSTYGSYNPDNHIYGVRGNPSSLHGSTQPTYQLNYSPNHAYNGHVNYEGDGGSTGGHQQTLRNYPAYAYPSAASGQAHMSHGYGYGHSTPERVSDYKTHETAVNAAALQAVQSIKGLNGDASYSFAGLGSPASSTPYGSLGSSLSGLFR